MVKKPAHEIRTHDEIKHDYEIEKALADKLRNATQEERKTLYPQVYSEYFEKVKKAPQIIRKQNTREKERYVLKQLNQFKHLLKPTMTFVEVGAGDCALSMTVASHVKKAYALEVSDHISLTREKPDNFEVITFDGLHFPFEDNSVDFVYSNQLMEHLHPDDAASQLSEIYRILKKGGMYYCITPSRLNGPHDISKYFDKQSTGFHLKEYTHGELDRMFSACGFSKRRSVIAAKGRYYFSLPVFMITVFENILGLLPHSLRHKLASFVPFKVLLGIKFTGIK